MAAEKKAELGKNFRFSFTFLNLTKISTDKITYNIENWNFTDTVKQEIGKCYGQLMNGYQKGDWKVTSEIYGPNCVILAPGKGAIKGRDGTI